MSSPIDFGDPAFISNPYSAYKLLQVQSPVYRSSSGTWIVTGYQEVAALLRDACMAKDFSGLAEILVKRGESEPAGSPLASEFSRWMLFRDPPEHFRLRGLAVKAFTPRMIASKRAAIEKLANSLLDRVAPQRHHGSDRGFCLSAPVFRDRRHSRPAQRGPHNFGTGQPQ